MKERDVSALVRQGLTRDPDVVLLRSGVGHGFAASVRPAIEHAIVHEQPTERIWQRFRVSWGAPGQPDFTGLCPGRCQHCGGEIQRAAYVETKSSTGRLRPEQVDMIATLQARGAFIAVVSDPGDVAAVLSAMRAGEASFGLPKRRG
jgi:hypothetical protein